MKNTATNKILALLLVLFAGLVFFERPHSWLFDPDEPRYAEIPREMIATGDYITPRLNGSDYFEKPPLLYWMNAASMSVFGETPYAARLPVRLTTLATALLLLVALASVSTAAGLWTAIVFLSAPLTFALSRVNLTDNVLTFFLTLTFLSLRDFVRREEDQKLTLLSEIGIGVGLAGSILSKGLVGIVFPAGVLVAWSVLTDRKRVLYKVLFSSAPLICIALTLPWFAAMETRHPGFNKFFFVREHVERFMTSSANRPGPAYYFIFAFLAGFLPWIVPFYRSAKKLVTRNLFALKQNQDDLFFGLWFLTIVAFFSLSKSKLIPYILPAIPAAAALAGKYLAKGNGLTFRKGLVTSLSCAGVFLILIFLVPTVAATYSDYGLAAAASRVGPDEVVSYRTYSQSLPWVLKKPVPVVDFKGELASDNELSPSLFWEQKDFWNRWNSDERMAVYVHKFRLNEFALPTRKNFTIVAENRRAYILTNFKPIVLASRRKNA